LGLCEEGKKKVSGEHDQKLQVVRGKEIRAWVLHWLERGSNHSEKWLEKLEAASATADFELSKIPN
jgi:hypothetical protein